MTTKRTNRTSKARRVSHVLASGKGVVGARRRKTVNDAISFETLESRQLMSVVNVSDFGAKANDGQNDLAAVQAAINQAKDGDTINFGAGQYDFNGTLNVPSNRKLTGAANHGSTLAFNTATNVFGIQLTGGSNITIDGLAIKANDGAIVAWGNTSHVNITNNDFVWGYNGTYYNRLAIRAAGTNEAMTIEHNYFHDSLSSDRSADLFNMQDSSYSYNKFYKVNDGGHLDGETLNFKFVGNVLTQVHRMGLELQNNWGDAGGNILIADNVLTDWYQPNGMSFGLSIMPQLTNNVTIQNNYISLGNTTVTADSGHGNYAGYGIESGLTTGVVQNNTIIGAWCMGITCSMPQTALKNNKIYGNQIWGPYGGEPGFTGGGSVQDLGGNQGNLPIGQAPPPPAPGGDTVIGQKSGVINVTAKVLSDTSVQLNWQNLKITPTSFRIDIISTVSREVFKSVTVNGAATSAVIKNMTPGWSIDFTIVALTASGNVSAAPISVHMTGTAPGGPGTGDPGNPSTGAVDVTKLKLESGTNGWGPYEVDKTNGEQAAGDGKTLSLRGTTYAKGFGVHAPSALVVKLDGNYSSFAALIGIDDETGGKGSVIFRIYGDGRKLFDSGTVSGTDAARKVNVDVSGVQKLKLVVVSPTGAIDNDHADWINPLLVRDTGSSVGSTPRNKKRYMQNVRMTNSANKAGDPEINKSNDGDVETINGKTFTKGVGVTAASKLVYALNGKYKTFASYVGMDDETESSGTVTFQVWGDGHMLYDSGTVNSTSRLRKVSVNVQGVKQLWLVVTPAQGGVKNASVHADWAQSYLLAA